MMKYEGATASTSASNFYILASIGYIMVYILGGLVLGIYVVQYKDIFVLFLIGPIILHRLFAALFASIGYGGSRYSCYYYTAMFMLVIACIQSVILIIILFLQSIEVDSQNLPVTLAAVLDFAWGFYVLYSPLSNATDSTGYFMVPTQMYVQRAN